MNGFETLLEPHRALLRLHCYRMLGSSHDSDDIQTSLLHPPQTRSSALSGSGRRDG